MGERSPMRLVTRAGETRSTGNESERRRTALLGGRMNLLRAVVVLADAGVWKARSGRPVRALASARR